jgi:hypothetical protein
MTIFFLNMKDLLVYLFQFLSLYVLKLEKISSPFVFAANVCSVQIKRPKQQKSFWVQFIFISFYADCDKYFQLDLYVGEWDGYTGLFV